MMRSALVLAACLAIAAPVSAAEIMAPVNFRVGFEGEFRDGDTRFRLKIVEILNKETLEVMMDGKPPAFLLKGYPTEGEADGKIIQPAGLWKVTGTRKRGTRTLYVIERIKRKR